MVSTIFVGGTALSFLSIFTIGPLGGFINKRFAAKRRQKKLRRKPEQSPVYCRSLPDDLKPAVVGKLMSVYDGSEKKLIRNNGGAFSATMLDLIERGVISIEDSGGKTSFAIRPGQTALCDFENTLIDTLCAATDDENVDIDELNRYLRDNPSAAAERAEPSTRRLTTRSTGMPLSSITRRGK